MAAQMFKEIKFRSSISANFCFLKDLIILM